MSLSALNPRGTEVRAERADRREAHTCIRCDLPMRLRRGPKVAAHFAHRPHESCAPEYVRDTQKAVWEDRKGGVSRRAEALVQLREVLGGWLAADGSRIAVQQPGARWSFLPPQRFSRLEIEETVPDWWAPTADPFLFDLVLYGLSDEPLVVVNLRPIAPHEWVALQRQGLHAVELLADDLLDGPHGLFNWVPLRSTYGQNALFTKDGLAVVPPPPFPYPELLREVSASTISLQPAEMD